MLQIREIRAFCLLGKGAREKERMRDLWFPHSEDTLEKGHALAPKREDPKEAA